MSRVAIAAVTGLVGTALTVALAIARDEPARVAFAWLVAFVTCTVIGVGAICLVTAFHLTGAKWPAVFRRQVESMGLAVIPLAVLGVPLAFTLPWLFAWMHPATGMSEHAAHMLEHKRAWLNAPFFLVRSAVYFAVWIVLASLFHAWSTRQDHDGGIGWTVKMRTLSGPAAVLLVLTASFAAFDWVMSLDPLWQSTVFGLYVLAGGFVGGLALVALFLAVARPPHVTPEHLHAVGKLLFAFSCVWAYLGFCQLMLVWIANLPEEATFYLVRLSGHWKWVGAFIAVAGFVAPFALLLPRASKRRPAVLGSVAAIVLAARWADVWWLVMPAALPRGPALHPSDLTAFAGVAGLAAAFVFFRASRAAPMPIRDPHLLQSMEYRS